MPTPRPETHRPTPVFDRILLARPMSIEVDWTRSLRSIERKRALARTTRVGLPVDFHPQMTMQSFRMDGIEVTPADLDDASANRQRAKRAFASRQRQRLRNHMAILLSIVRQLTRRQSFTPTQVVRWYTCISAGLSLSSIGGSGIARIESTLRNINSPQMRLQPAITDIARLHADLLNDPIFPSFNGILTRLFLQAHLGNCGLPLIVFDPTTDPPRVCDFSLLLPRLLDLIDSAFDRLITQ